MAGLASTAARKAGQSLRSRIAEWNHVTSNKPRDIKLGADRQSEEIILAILRGDSNFPVLSEETGETGNPDPQGYRWIVDPLDGSVNYRYGLPLACVSIALWRDTIPCCGVVYDFWRDELFHAAAGFGTFLNGQPTRVTATTCQDQAIIATGFPANRDFADDALRMFLSTLQRFRKVRLLGSAALSLAYVASGRVDAYYEEDIMLWDVAAGLTLVNSAGGYTSVEMSKRVPNACRVFAAARPELVPHFPS
jgi:myo-inositol-1(or 4)-monophosphatase